MGKHYLVADIGGTKSELAVYSSRGDIRKYLLKERFATCEYDSLEILVQHFLQKHKLKIDSSVLAVAGPVINQRVTEFSSNLPWEIDAVSLQKSLAIPNLRVINDLRAVAGAIPFLQGEDIYTLNSGIESQHETLTVIAPGTGLGEAFLIWDGLRYKPCVSEGAHVNFGPRTELEMGLLRHLKKSQEHVTYESVCSGLGIPSIYEYLASSKAKVDSPIISSTRYGTEDLTRTIINMAGKKEDADGIAEETLLLFASILGAEAGNLVLKIMSTGGVFLAGGIPPRIIPYLDSRNFLDSFFDKGVMSEMMPDVPIHIITNPDTAIFGAADYLFNEIAL